MASRDIVAGYATGGCDGVAAAVRREAASGQEDRESRAGGLGEGKLGQELRQEPLTGPLSADASRGGAAARSLSCGSAWSV